LTFRRFKSAEGLSGSFPRAPPSPTNLVFWGCSEKLLRIRPPQAKLLCGVISGNFVVNSGTGLTRFLLRHNNVYSASGFNQRGASACSEPKKRRRSKQQTILAHHAIVNPAIESPIHYQHHHRNEGRAHFDVLNAIDCLSTLPSPCRVTIFISADKKRDDSFHVLANSERQNSSAVGFCATFRIGPSNAIERRSIIQMRENHAIGMSTLRH
jgi:hypothetical protein